MTYKWNTNTGNFTLHIAKHTHTHERDTRNPYEIAPKTRNKYEPGIQEMKMIPRDQAAVACCSVPS